MRRPSLLEAEIAVLIVLQLASIGLAVWGWLDVQGDIAAVRDVVDGICKRMTEDSWVYC